MSETIINGIDVSECYFYNSGKCDNPNGMACNCINNAVCYFKELKHLQEENKKLKEENEQLKKHCLIMPKVKQLAVPIEKYEKLYKALEEIRNIAETPIIADKNRFDEITNKINEVLNDRD